jgi:hydrogenase small subunit
MVAPGSAAPFVLVVEGATQSNENNSFNNGYWNAAKAGNGAPWCSIGQNGTTGAEAEFPDVVLSLSAQANCVAVISIGQCASFGGYPACKSPVLGQGQTGAQGTHDFLSTRNPAAAAKVINVPGCPANPWWFILTVVVWLVDFASGGGFIASVGGLDPQRRLRAVYGTPIHGPACPRYQDYANGVFATKPGDPGCLQLIGCKGPSTNSLCAVHGWNSLQPHNNPAWEYGQGAITGVRGGFCVSAGHPCMGCTEKGYPDSVVPFVVR